MNLLLLGGTGVISTACTHLALEHGHAVTLLTRSGRGLPPGARALTADISDPRAAAAALAGSVSPSAARARARQASTALTWARNSA